MKWCVLLIILMASCASALNDAYIQADTASTGICYSLGDADHPVCNGNFLRINGTSDHDLYMVNSYGSFLDLNISAIQNQTQMNDLMETWIISPWYLLLAFGGGIVFIFVFLGGGYIAASYIVDHLPGG